MYGLEGGCEALNGVPREWTGEGEERPLRF